MVTLGDQTEWQEKNLEHMRYEYDLKPDDWVFDIGSYRREFADEIIRRYGCHVECFDALDNKAAWLFDGFIEMANDYLYTSIYGDGPKKSFRCVDVARFIDKPIALMKINIEGGEYELIKYLAKKHLLKMIKNLQIQFHIVDDLFTTTNRYEYVRELLSETHTLTWRFPFVWESWTIV
jgi:hypothetical protein